MSDQPRPEDDPVVALMQALSDLTRTVSEETEPPSEEDADE